MTRPLLAPGVRHCYFAPMTKPQESLSIYWRMLYFGLALTQLTIGILLNLSTRNNIILAMGAMSLFTLWVLLTWLKDSTPRRLSASLPTNSALPHALIIQTFLLSSALTAGGHENPLWWLSFAPLLFEGQRLVLRQSFVFLALTLAGVFLLFILPSEQTDVPLLNIADKVQFLTGVIIVIFFWVLSRLQRFQSLNHEQTLQQIWFEKNQKEKLANLSSLTSALLHKMGTPLNAALLDIEREQRKSPGKENIQDALASLQQCESYLREINWAFENQNHRLKNNIDLSLELPRWLQSFPGAQSFVEQNLQWHGDLNTLTEALEVLIQNAMEFAGHCEFRALRKQNQLVFEVIDKGPGFSAEILGQWGQPYNSSRGTHHGMGLYNVYLFALSQGGQLSAENLSSGGARVQLTIRGSQNEFTQ